MLAVGRVRQRERRLPGTRVRGTIRRRDRHCVRGCDHRDHADRRQWLLVASGWRSEGVQVSYHTPDDFTPRQGRGTQGSSTPVNVPGANDAFVKRIALPNGTTNDVEYVVFNDGTVQIAFSGPSGFLTDQNESSVTKAFVG